jgi:hypothetical protein
MRQLLVICIVLAIAFRTSAQSYHIGGAIPTIDHSGILSDRWSYSLYYFGAFNMLNPEFAGKRELPYFGAFYAENAVNYAVSDNLSLSGSYVYERQNVFKKTYRNEHRFYTQATYKWKSGSMGYKLRLRYDGRFIENRVTQQWPYTSRVRFLAGLGKDLGSSGKWYAAAYQEFFFDTYAKAPVVYAENWAFAGLGYRFHKSQSLEFGPLYIFWVNNARYNLTNFYYLQLTWVSSWSVRKS